MIIPRVQSIHPPPVYFDPTFVNARGVTHENLYTTQMGEVSLCGQPRRPSASRHDTFRTLRAYARSKTPESVDCMSCLVRRAQLDSMIQGPQPEAGHVIVELDVATETLR